MLPVFAEDSCALKSPGLAGPPRVAENRLPVLPAGVDALAGVPLVEVGTESSLEINCQWEKNAKVLTLIYVCTYM